jgi:K+-transporting ATPase ATPase A chain
VPQTLNPYTVATTLEGAQQTIAQGPVASQMMPSRCSAPMAAASSTPMPRIRSRTPTALVNLIQMVMIFAIGAALTNVFGRMVGNQRRAGRSWPPWASCSSPASRLLLGRGSGNPLVHALGIDGGNMEGKEARFGIVSLGAVRRRHHGRLLRRGQCHA